MNNTINIASAKPGTGKTQSFIKAVDGSEDIVLALPTKTLSEDVKRRLEGENIKVSVINSDTHHKDIKGCVEYELKESSGAGVIVIITQKTLQVINPVLLKGWKVVLDEVPDITNVHTRQIGEHLFKDNFDHLITWNDEGDVSIQDGKALDVHVRFLEAVYDNNMSTQSLVFGALLNPNAEVKINIDTNNNSLKYWVNVVDHHDYEAIIKSCDEFHIMGNAVEKSLFYEYVKAKGFDIKTSKYTPAKRPYSFKPTLVPLFEDKRYSKSMLFQGGDGEKMSSDSVGYKAVQRALAYVDGKEVLFQGNKWMSIPGAFPFKDHTNVTIIPGDARGLNTYSNVHYSIHMMHGNPDPNLDPLNTSMLKMMGVREDAGKAAIRHERSTERTVQGITRTPIRKFDAQKQPTVHIVTTMEEAKNLEIELGIKCIFDLSIMEKTPKTVSALNRDALKQCALELHKQNESFRAIGKKLGKSPATISNWIKKTRETEERAMVA